MPSKSGIAMSMGSGSLGATRGAPDGRGRHAAVAEVSPVLGGAHGEGAAEGAVQGLDAAEPAAGRDLGEAALGGLEEAAGGLDALGLDIGGGRRADLAAEGAGEVARAHA